MTPRRKKSRQAAIRAALREAERLLLTDETVCVTVYQRLGVASLFHLEGRSRKQVASFSWDTDTEDGS